MKKLILSLLIFFSVISQAQIQIPQVVGLPVALNSKVDKVTGKSLVADTLSAKIQPHVTNLSNPHGVTKAQVELGNADNTSDVNKPISTAAQSALNLKQDKLPFPETPTLTKFLRDDNTFFEVAAGAVSSSTKLFLSNTDSETAGFKKVLLVVDAVETPKTIVANNNTVWGEKYIFDSQLGTATIPSGIWVLSLYSSISSTTAVSNIMFRVVKRSNAGVETILFEKTSDEINNTTVFRNELQSGQGSFPCIETDRTYYQIGFKTTRTQNTTLTYYLGDGNASYAQSTLPLRHIELRDPNGDPNVQHLTAAQVTKVNNTSGINTGDETLTSIKSKLGAATAVSDGYLKYQDWNTFNEKQAKLNGSGFVKSFSGEITYDANNYEIAFSKNTGFNKNFGTTTGTVLEGRTFGTAANSAVGDFQPIENQRLSTTNSPSFLNSTTINSATSSILELNNTAANGKNWKIQALSDGRLYIGATGQFNHYIDGTTGASTFASTVSSTGFLLNGNNLTSSLTTNYIPKWNGSSFVNSLISESGSSFILPDFKIYPDGSNIALQSFSSKDLSLNPLGNLVRITSTYQSTSPTTGALVVNGGVGVGGKVYASGFAKTGGSSTQVWTTDGGYIESSSVGGTSGNGSLTVVGSSNFGSATVISHTYSVIGNIVTESIACSGTPSSSGVFWIDVAPQYESKATGFTPTGTGTLDNGTIYPAIAWIYKSPTSVVRLSSPNGILSTNNRITIMIQYEKQ